MRGSTDSRMWRTPICTCMVCTATQVGRAFWGAGCGGWQKEQQTAGWPGWHGLVALNSAAGEAARHARRAFQAVAQMPTAPLLRPAVCSGVTHQYAGVLDVANYVDNDNIL